MFLSQNIGNALETPFEFVRNTQTLLESRGFGPHLNETDYDYDMAHGISKTGTALHSLLVYINWGIDDAVNQTDYNLTFNYLLQADIYLVAAILTVSDFL